MMYIYNYIYIYTLSSQFHFRAYSAFSPLNCLESPLGAPSSHQVSLELRPSVLGSSIGMRRFPPKKIWNNKSHGPVTTNQILDWFRKYQPLYDDRWIYDIMGCVFVYYDPKSQMHGRNCGQRFTGKWFLIKVVALRLQFHWIGTQPVRGILNNDWQRPLLLDQKASTMVLEMVFIFLWSPNNMGIGVLDLYTVYQKPHEH